MERGRASQISPRTPRARSSHRPTSSASRPLRSRRRICNGLGQRAAGPASRRARAATTGFKASSARSTSTRRSTTAARRVDDTVDGQPITDPFGQPGLPGLRRHAREEHARLRRADAGGRRAGHVRLHLGRARRPRHRPGTIHRAVRPRRGRLRAAAAATTTTAFGEFFDRLQNDGITKDNTLFVVTVEEGDHFAGTAPDDPCDGVTTPCTYTNGHVTEVNGDLQAARRHLQRGHGTSRRRTSASTPTWRRTSTSPAIPPATPPTSRNLEQAMSRHERDEPATRAVQQNLVRRAGRSGRGEDAAHGHGRSGTDADVHAVRRRATSSSPRSSHDAVREQRPLELRFAPGTAPPNQSFAWNHGGIQPEIAIDLARAGSGRESKNGDSSAAMLDRSHRRPADDARAARPEGRLRVRRPRGDPVRDRTALPRRLRTHHREHAGARAGLQADQRVLRAVLDGHADRLDAGARQQLCGRLDLHRHRGPDRFADQPAERARRRRSGPGFNQAEFNDATVEREPARRPGRRPRTT